MEINELARSFATRARQWPRDVVVAMMLTLAALALLSVTLFSEDEGGRSAVATNVDVAPR